MVMRLAPALHHAISCRDLELLLDVYAAARHVEATLPDGDLACIAAKKIIASFHSDVGASTYLRSAIH